MKSTITKHLRYILLLFPFTCPAQSVTDSVIIKILPLQKKEYFFTRQAFYEMKNNKPVLLSGLEYEIQDAIEYHDTIWIGTSKRVYLYALKQPGIKQVNTLPAELNISKIKADEEGAIWIASKNDGLWRLKNNKAEKLLDISPVYSLEIAADRSVWAGSNVGLYKLNKQTNSWQRYAEEGYSGYEIPDNIVENLFSDLRSNMWVIMPDEFAFIRSQDNDGHVPGFRNISAQDFELKHIAEIIPGQYVFITSKGIFLMRNRPAEHDHTQQEIKTVPDQKMYLLSNKQLLLNNSLDAKDITAVSVDKKGNLILSYTNTIYCIKKKTIKGLSEHLEKM